MSRGDLNISRWLEAHCDRSANLTTFPRNAILCDTCGDGDHRLVLIDVKNPRSRLKVYKGTLLTSDQVLPDISSSIIGFYGDNLEPHIPSIAVASCSDLLIYKNNKPFFKFTVPATPLQPLEEECWKRFAEPDYDCERIVADLKSLDFNALSGRSQELLLLQEGHRLEYIQRFVGTTPVNTTPIVCMATLNRNNPNKDSIACPVLGTESGNIYILDPQVFTVLHQANVCSFKATPAIIRTQGMFDVDFRIVVSTRENKICVLRRGWLEGKSIIQLNEDIVDFVLVPGENFIVVGTTAKFVHCYTKRGQRVWSTYLPTPPTCLCLVPLPHLSTNLIAVGLRNASIHLYHGRHPVDYTSVPDPPSSLTFGQLGQEEHVLVVVTMNGTLNFKILKRTADFNLSSHDKTTAPSLQSKPLPLPKRSKLFIEQSMRERGDPIEMHQSFQRDLVRLRLAAARQLVQMDQSGAGNVGEMVKLSAQVLGLGPRFTLLLSVENMNGEKSVEGFSVVFHARKSVYRLSSYVCTLPLIPPGLSYKVQTKVDEVLDESRVEGQAIRVFVLRRGQAHPVLAASITMPPTEMGTLLM